MYGPKICFFSLVGSLLGLNKTLLTLMYGYPVLPTNLVSVTAGWLYIKKE